MASNVQGVIYLLHFDRPYRHAGHYTGRAASSGLLRFGRPTALSSPNSPG
jgi:hypothetical protein